MRRTAALVVACLAPLVGCGKPAPAVPPTAAGSSGATARTPPPVFAGEWRAALDGASIPDLPASGEIRGVPFALEAAELNDGILRLKQGLEFFADREFIVFLFLQEGSIPEGKTWDVKADKGFDRPHIHVGYKLGKDSMPQHDMAMSGYAMRLEFGKESGKRIPGKIWLCMEADPREGEPPNAPRRSWVAGTFTATVRGFILRDGQPDRTEDAPKLLPWLAEEKLRAQHPGKVVAVTKSMSGMMSTGRPTGTGSTDVEWSLEGVSQGWLKVRCAKQDGTWAVSDLLPGDQIPDAHPKQPPDPKGGADTIKYLAAVELERQHAGKVVHLQGSLSPQLKAGVAAVCQACVQVEGQDDWTTTWLLFRWTDGGWAFDRVLDAGERFDSRTGSVGKR